MLIFAKAAPEGELHAFYAYDLANPGCRCRSLYWDNPSRPLIFLGGSSVFIVIPSKNVAGKSDNAAHRNSIRVIQVDFWDCRPTPSRTWRKIVAVL
jgi:hypothetical protein